jgi:hypothetical protein
MRPPGRYGWGVKWRVYRTDTYIDGSARKWFIKKVELQGAGDFVSTGLPQPKNPKVRTFQFSLVATNDKVRVY